MCICVCARTHANKVYFKILVTYNHSYNAASDWPQTFYSQAVFVLDIFL